MSIKKVLLSITYSLLVISSVSAQRPPHKPDEERFNHLDSNKNGTIERGEFIADADEIFKNLDRNNDNVLDASEMPAPPAERGNFSPRRGERKSEDSERPKLPPPFMMRDANPDGKLTRAEFDENLRRHYAVMDADGDNVITREEFDRTRKGDGRRHPPRPGDFPPSAPTVEFLGAEMRFGDKLVKDAPFSAEIVIENTRRLYDGSTVTAQSKGAIYRDAAGRTRREQPLESVGAFSLGNEAQKLIFITDASQGTQYFLDRTRKIARRIPLGNNRPTSPPTEAGAVKTESLGKKILEGVNVDGTRATLEIPAGRVGNDKPLQIITERWYSNELQTAVLIRHVDPLMGEQVFRLVNIRRGEPARELFTVPNDYRIEIDRKPR